MRARADECSFGLLQCLIVDDSSDDGRVVVLIEAIDRPRLLNDITRIITEESGLCVMTRAAAAALVFYVLSAADFEITSAQITTEHGVVKDRLAIRPVSWRQKQNEPPRQCLTRAAEKWHLGFEPHAAAGTAQGSSSCGCRQQLAQQ